MLVLAVHTVADQAAKVPFAAILLKEMATTPDKMPPELRLRQLLPTSGPVFTSLWDAPSVEALQRWLDSNVSVNVSHLVSEVHEAFALGLGDVVRQRAGDQLAAGASAVGSQVKTTARDLNDRLHLSEKTAGAVEAVRESQVARGFESARRSAVSAAHRVAESERYQAAAQAASNQVKKFQSAFSSWRERAFRKSGARGAGAAVAGAGTEAYAPLGETADDAPFSSSAWGEPPAAQADGFAPVTLSSPPVTYINAEPLQATTTTTTPISIAQAATPSPAPPTASSSPPPAPVVSSSPPPAPVVSPSPPPAPLASSPPSAPAASSPPSAPAASSPPPAPLASSPPPTASPQAKPSAGASFSLVDDEP